MPNNIFEDDVQAGRVCILLILKWFICILNFKQYLGILGGFINIIKIHISLHAGVIVWTCGWSSLLSYRWKLLPHFQPINFEDEELLKTNPLCVLLYWKSKGECSTSDTYVHWYSNQSCFSYSGNWWMIARHRFRGMLDTSWLEAHLWVWLSVGNNFILMPSLNWHHLMLVGVVICIILYTE